MSSDVMLGDFMPDRFVDAVPVVGLFAYGDRMLKRIMESEPGTVIEATYRDFISSATLVLVYTAYQATAAEFASRLVDYLK